MTPTLPGEVTGVRFLRAMARFGWTVVRQTGSHRTLAHVARTDTLHVAFHQTIGRNSIRRALRQAGIDDLDFAREL